MQEAGFPLFDERTDGRKVWRLVEGYKQRLTQTFTLAELSALYFSKNLMSFLGGAPFAQDLDAAFAKIREALPARSLPYLARIQDLFSARPDPWKDYSNKQDIIAKVAKDTGLKKVSAAAVVDSIIDGITKSLKKGDQVSFVGFGTFKISNRKARVARNPQTGAAIKIPKRRVPRFSAGKALRQAVR